MREEEILLYAVAYVLYVIAVGIVGSTRQIGFTAATFISIFFTPVVGIICAYLTPVEVQEKPDESKLTSDLQSFNPANKIESETPPAPQ